MSLQSMLKATSSVVLVATAAAAQQPSQPAKPAAPSSYAIPIGASITLDAARKAAAGASALASLGEANITLTALALALRLTDRLVTALGEVEQAGA